MTVCGDTRYDRVMEVAKSGEVVNEIEQFKGVNKLVVCGSTWPEDEALLVKCIANRPEVKFVVAPHEIGEGNLLSLEKLFQNTIRFSEFKSSASAQILLIDNVGLLNKLYRYADVAYIGGAFKTGLHNILEATAFSNPTIFGPDYTRFADAGEMVASGLAFSVKNEKQLDERLTELLEKDQTEFRSRINLFMNQRVGATNTILEYLKAAS